MLEAKENPASAGTGCEAQDMSSTANDTSERPPKPAPVEVIEEAIPGRLKDCPQWICWRWEWNGKKWDKPPFKADGTGKASSTDPKTWTSFSVAFSAYQSGNFDGIGFVLTESDPFTMVDLDKCTGESWAVDIMNALHSYTEGTPSDNGYHVILDATKPESMGSKSKDFHSSRVEVYSSGRYMTMTGNHISGYPLTIEKRQGQLESACKQLFRKQEKPKASTPAPQAANLNDHDLIERMFRACKGSEGLYRGNQSDDASADDLALCNHLAFMTGSDAARMDRLFRQSGLMRPKWDKRHRSDGATYGQMTIEKSIEGTHNAYDPSREQDAPAPMAKTPEQVASELDALEIPEPERPGAFAIPESCKGTFAVRMGLDLARSTEMPQATAVLTALGAFSGILSMVFCTGYADGSRLPVGLYTVAEQPPATAKSRLLNSFAKPWLKAVKRYNAQRMEEAEQEAEQEEGSKPKKPHLLPLPFSNATPEAMEQAMTQDDTGHYWLQSAEQGAIHMLFGDGVKDRPKNFDLALKGFNGEFHSSARVTRQKLLKEVYGAITVLAQAGSIRTILSNSDGDGLAERFLFVAEPHNLGKRTHSAGPPDPFLRADFEQVVSGILNSYQTIHEGKRGELEELHYLGFSDAAHEVIRQHKIRIEPKLAQHADNGEMVMTALLGKSDMQAMKLAAVMYLSDCLASGKPYAAKVPDEYLTAGLELAMTLVKHIEAVLVSMERIGPEAARDAIRRQFDKRPERTIREIVQNVKKVKPFSDNPSPSAYAKRIITGMVNRGELLQVGNRLQLG